LCTWVGVMLINTPRDLGSAIRERRKTLGWDQVELAERVGASRRWLIQVESGKSGASFGLLLRTLHALGLSMELTSGDERTQSADGAPLTPLDLGAVLDRARGGSPS